MKNTTYQLLKNENTWWYLVHSEEMNRHFVLNKQSLMEKRRILDLKVMKASENYIELSNSFQN